MIYWDEECDKCNNVKKCWAFDLHLHVVITLDGDFLPMNASDGGWAIEQYAKERELSLKSVRKAYKLGLINIYCELGKDREIHQMPSGLYK